MKFVAEAGLWTTGAVPAPPPLTAVLEVAGAVLSWTVDEPDSGPHITFTDVRRADWLWRLVGDDGHASVLTALSAGPAAGATDVAVPAIDGAELATLRRLAVGHWLRRWWPASRRDGIAELDAALLDGEIALLTSGVEAFFSDDTVDSDLSELLAPHAGAFDRAGWSVDPRVSVVFGACRELADDLGVAQRDGTRTGLRRDDYALAAGPGRRAPQGTTVAAGVSSVSWAAVPPGVFDAAEGTIDWRVEVDVKAVTAQVRVELAGAGSAGIEVAVESGDVAGTGVLADTGTSSVGLVDAAGDAVAEATAWNHDWGDTVVRLGPAVHETAEMRDRTRQFARSRLQAPSADAYLAEVLAAESDY